MTRKTAESEKTSPETEDNEAVVSDEANISLSVPDNDIRILEYYNQTFINIIDRQMNQLNEESKTVERSLMLLNGGGVVATLSFLASSNTPSDYAPAINILSLFVFGFISLLLYHLTTSGKRA